MVVKKRVELLPKLGTESLLLVRAQLGHTHLLLFKFKLLLLLEVMLLLELLVALRPLVVDAPWVASTLRSCLAVSLVVVTVFGWQICSRLELLVLLIGCMGLVRSEHEAVVIHDIEVSAGLLATVEAGASDVGPEEHLRVQQRARPIVLLILLLLQLGLLRFLSLRRCA